LEAVVKMSKKKDDKKKNAKLLESSLKHGSALKKSTKSKKDKRVVFQSSTTEESPSVAAVRTPSLLDTEEADGSPVSTTVGDSSQPIPSSFAEGESSQPPEVTINYDNEEDNGVPLPLRRGVVFVARLPPSFDEKQMRRFFKKFGVVTRVRRQRSKRTGNVRSYGWVEFADYDVAGVVADHTNTVFLDGKRLYAERLPQGHATSKLCHKAVSGTKRNKESNMSKLKMQSDIDLNSITPERKQHMKQRLNEQLDGLKSVGIKWGILTSE